MTIVSNPEHVCVDHALEFWTGLLDYARERRRDPCMKNQGLCTCRACVEVGSSYPRSITDQPSPAPVAAAPPLPDNQRLPISLAS